MYNLSIFWFRRDLRLEDNHGLFQALSQSKSVLPLFIFDTHILSQLEAPHDRRVDFIYCCLEKIQQKLNPLNKQLHIYIGKPEEIFTQILSNYKPDALFFNRDYEPYAKKRDKRVQDLFQSYKTPVHHHKDSVLLEPGEVLKKDGKPYTVFTPFAKTHSRLLQFPIPNYDSNSLIHHFSDEKAPPFQYAETGFEYQNFNYPKQKISIETLKSYEADRNYPAKETGTSHLGIHLRFGTLSPRIAANAGHQHSQTWLNELQWRDFFQHIMHFFPYTESQSFKKDYDKIPWLNNSDDFDTWKKGNTGYPLVDAGMKQLRESGTMHNRVRMLCASFLCKHLLIDWRWGERHFARYLLDFELASNVGNWQWAAGSGCDAAPYFRIFNPYTQQEKFDPKFDYIKKWIPNYKPGSYLKEIVDHKFARERAINHYKLSLSK